MQRSNASHLGRTSRHIAGLSAIVFGLGALAACGGDDEGSGGSGDGDSLSIAIAGAPANMDFLIKADGQRDSFGLGNVVQGLTTRVSSDMSLQPSLATEWSSDGENTWTFILREGVTFSDGSDFNADDVVYTIDEILDPANGSEQAAGNISSVESATKVDDYTVEIVTSAPDPALPARLAIVGIAPDGTTTEERAEELVGTGPYKQAEWDKADHIVLEGRDDAWEEPTWESVTVYFRPEASTRIAALSTGEVQLAADLSPELATSAPAVATAPQSVVGLFRLNTEAGPLQDVRLREAVNLAIDRQSLVDAVYGGYAQLPKSQPIGDTAFGYDPNMTDYPYDPERAAELVDEVGGDIALSMMGSSGRTLKDQEAAQAVAAMLEDVGFTVKAEFPTLDRWVADAVYAPRPTGPDLVYIGHGNEPLDAAFTAALYFGCEGDISRFCDSATDELIASADSELDETKRAELYGQVWQRMKDDYASAPLANLQSVTGIAKDIDWQPRSDGFLHFDDIAIK